MAQYKSRDSQNPYRTGVLVGNYVEDNFGQELSVAEVSVFNQFNHCHQNKETSVFLIFGLRC